MGGARRFTQQLGKTVGRQRMMRHDGPGTRSSFDIAEAAEAAQRLNLLVALFLPLTAVASVFGMNLPSGLESAAAPLLVWFVLVAEVVVGLLLRLRLGGTEAS
jgi:hypothetical protein